MKIRTWQNRTRSCPLPSRPDAGQVLEAGPKRRPENFSCFIGCLHSNIENQICVVWISFLLFKQKCLKKFFFAPGIALRIVRCIGKMGKLSFIQSQVINATNRKSNTSVCDSYKK